MMKIPLFLAILVVANHCATANPQYQASCQQSLADGRVLVANGGTLPIKTQFKVLVFKVTESANGWNTGPCLVEPTQTKTR
jgi:hypothetical protein